MSKTCIYASTNMAISLKNSKMEKLDESLQLFALDDYLLWMQAHHSIKRIYAELSHEQSCHMELWHWHIRNVNLQKLKHMEKSTTVNGLSHFGHINFDHVCAACQFGKQTQLSFSKRGRVTNMPLEFVHTNV